MNETDGKLLAAYLETGDNTAFERLFHRHRALVYGVCARHLGTQADDGVQLVFMLLIRKGGALKRRDSIASWLYGAALNLSRKLVRADRRRLAREREFGCLGKPRNSSTPDSLLPILDEEIARLPERLQEPLLLCCGEGLTQFAAAAQLGWSEGKLRSRLEKARKTLQKRLVGRGFVVGGLALLVSFRETVAACPPTLACESELLAKAKLFAAGKPLGLPALHEQVLTEVSRMMMWAKIKVVTSGIAMIAFATAGTAVAGNLWLKTGHANSLMLVDPGSRSNNRPGADENGKPAAESGEKDADNQGKQSAAENSENNAENNEKQPKEPFVLPKDKEKLNELRLELDTKANQIRARLGQIEHEYTNDDEVKKAQQASSDAAMQQSLEFRRFSEEVKENQEMRRLRKEVEQKPKKGSDNSKVNEKINALYARLEKEDTAYWNAKENFKAAYAEYRRIMVEKASQNAEYAKLRKELTEEIAPMLILVLKKLHGDDYNTENIANW